MSTVGEGVSNSADRFTAQTHNHMFSFKTVFYFDFTLVIFCDYLVGFRYKYWFGF